MLATQHPCGANTAPASRRRSDHHVRDVRIAKALVGGAPLQLSLTNAQRVIGSRPAGIAHLPWCGQLTLIAVSSLANDVLSEASSDPVNFSEIDYPM